MPIVKSEENFAPNVSVTNDLEGADSPLASRCVNHSQSETKGPTAEGQRCRARDFFVRLLVFFIVHFVILRKG